MNSKKSNIASLHQAAKIIEVDGSEGIKTATHLVGEDVALALLIAHMRRALGSMKSYPVPPGIEEAVNQRLEELEVLKEER